MSSGVGHLHSTRIRGRCPEQKLPSFLWRDERIAAADHIVYFKLKGNINVSPLILSLLTLTVL